MPRARGTGKLNEPPTGESAARGCVGYASKCGATDDMTYEKNTRLSSCPHCGQRMPELRLGVRLFPMTARVFDVIRRAGADGISGREAFNVAYQGMRKPKYMTFKAHVAHIRDALAGTDYTIRTNGGSASGRHPVYRLVKVVSVKAFAAVFSHASD